MKKTEAEKREVVLRKISGLQRTAERLSAIDAKLRGGKKLTKRDRKLLSKDVE